MACDLTAIQAEACESGIGLMNDPIALLQIIAQLTADQVVAASPSTEITPAAIMERACTSGIGKVNDELTLLTIIAQNSCELVP